MDSLRTICPKLAASVSIAATIVLLAYQWLKPKPLPGIPHNPITSIWGDIPELRRLTKTEDVSLLGYLDLLVERHGPVVQLCIGRNITLLLADPVEIDRLFLHGKNLNGATTLAAVFRRLVPTGQIAHQVDDTWKRHRRALAPTMRRSYLQRMAPHVSVAANALVKLWSTKTALARGTSFEAARDIQLMTMDGMVSIITGSSLGALQTAFNTLSVQPSALPGVSIFTGSPSPSICVAIDAIMSSVNLGIQLPVPAILFPLCLFLRRDWRGNLSLLKSYLWEHVKIARASGGGLKRGEPATDADCIIDMLAREGELELSDREILDELILFIIAGQGATATSTSWFVKYMATDLQIQRRLHNEVCNVFGTEPIDSLATLDNPERTPVLEAVTTETLRCATVASATRRELVRDLIIAGHHVPRGTEVVALNGYIGLSEVQWGPDAKQWRPSRWLRPDGSFNHDAGPTGNPFGLGQKSCFGQKLAVMELKIFIATLSRAFVFKPVANSVSSWTPITQAAHRPKISYVSLELWDD